MTTVGKSVPDFVGAALLVALGTAFAVGALQYDVYGQGGRIGPGFMPLAAGILLAVFGAMVGVEAWWRHARGVSQRPEERESEESVSSEDTPSQAVASEANKDAQEQHVEAVDRGDATRSLILVFVLTSVAILLIPVLGFLVSFGLLILGLITFVERESLLLGVVLSVGTTVIAWLVFVQFLRIPLPQGILELVLGG